MLKCFHLFVGSYVCSSFIGFNRFENSHVIGFVGIFKRNGFNG